MRGRELETERTIGGSGLGKRWHQPYSEEEVTMEFHKLERP